VAIPRPMPASRGSSGSSHQYRVRTMAAQRPRSLLAVIMTLRSTDLLLINPASASRIHLHTAGEQRRKNQRSETNDVDREASPRDCPRRVRTSSSPSIILAASSWTRARRERVTLTGFRWDFAASDEESSERSTDRHRTMSSDGWHGT
jgi:hypothetical protein